MVTFLEKKKYRNRCPKDLENFRKLKVLSQHLSTLMSIPVMDENHRFEGFFELDFKFGNIRSPRLNELYLEQYPVAINYFQEL